MILSEKDQRVPQQRIGVIGIELNCALEFFLRGSPMELIALVQAERGVRFREIGIQTQRFLCSILRKPRRAPICKGLVLQAPLEAPE